MQEWSTKKKIVVVVLIAIATDILYLIMLLNMDTIYATYDKILWFLHPLVKDFIIPILPPTAAAILLGKEMKEKITLFFLGISLFLIAIFMLFSMLPSGIIK